MRIPSLSVIAFAIFSSLLALPARAQLIAGWSFNDSTPPTVDLAVDHGAGTLTLSGVGSGVGLPTGTTVNAYSGDSAGDSLAVSVASLSSSGYTQLVFSTTGTASPVLSYAIGTTVGTVTLQWSYSSDGTNFTTFSTPFTPPTISSTSDLSLISAETVDLTSVGALSSQSQVYLRGTFTNTGVSIATIVIDNIQINASAIPEPATYALWSGGLFGLLVVLRRRSLVRCKV
ncbi:MAG: hypothetical protein JF599_03530 [Verrucomicrobia bacterium]|nr:hypothetical protein [Verrucomicrobiota bacterium]